MNAELGKGSHKQTSETEFSLILLNLFLNNTAIFCPYLKEIERQLPLSTRVFSGIKIKHRCMHLLILQVLFTARLQYILENDAGG